MFVKSLTHETIISEVSDHVCFKYFCICTTQLKTWTMKDNKFSWVNESVLAPPPCFCLSQLSHLESSSSSPSKCQPRWPFLNSLNDSAFSLFGFFSCAPPTSVFAYQIPTFFFRFDHKHLFPSKAFYADLHTYLSYRLTMTESCSPKSILSS